MAEEIRYTINVNLKSDPLVVDMSTAIALTGYSETTIRRLVDWGYLKATKPPTRTRKGVEVPGDLRIYFKSIVAYLEKGNRDNMQQKISSIVEELR